MSENMNLEKKYYEKHNGKNVIEKIKVLFAEDYSGHDYFHSERVYKNAMYLAEKITCNREIVALASLLHDVDDSKLFSTTNNQNARQIIKEIDISNDLIEKVILIINNISFKGTGKTIPDSIEGKIVQDADRLDAIGAIGIARAFAYGGNHNRHIFNPNEAPLSDLTEATYRENNGTTINHFYEKLLLLKDLMNTDVAKEIAENRTKFMKVYLEQFMREWNGEA